MLTPFPLALLLRSWNHSLDDEPFSFFWFVMESLCCICKEYRLDFECEYGGVMVSRSTRFGSRDEHDGEKQQRCGGDNDDVFLGEGDGRRGVNVEEREP